MMAMAGPRRSRSEPRNCLGGCLVTIRRTTAAGQTLFVKIGDGLNHGAFDVDDLRVLAEPFPVYDRQAGRWRSPPQPGRRESR